MPIPVIDIFAGPGGLGEGFSNVFDENNERVFDIKLSIEKDKHAHKTLELRSFFRQFPLGEAPDEYYEFVKNYNPAKDKEQREALFAKFPTEAQIIKNEAWQCTLGDDNFPPEKVDERISTALNGERNWVLIGGPPCQAYSLVGRSRNRGISEEDHRVFLYREYLRIIAVHHPAIFVMENVKGLLSAKLDGNRIFDWIKSDLKNPSRVFPGKNSPKYRIYSFVKEPYKSKGGDPIYTKDEDYLIKTERFGVPQNRHRVILLGVRDDIVLDNFQPLKETPKRKLKDVIGELPKLRSGIGREICGENAKGKNKYKAIPDSWKNWEKAVTGYSKKVSKELDVAYSVKNVQLQTGSNFTKTDLIEVENPLKDWYHDSRLGGVLNHETRTHLKEDLARYLFSSLYLKKNSDFPKLRDYPDWLLPNHKNAKGGKFADRFRTQRPEQPATTVTSHISKDGHYFIHYDPEQCRSLTVREAARIQTFPDNYLFCGTRTQQYHQVGNAVPPYLAKQLAEIVKDIFQYL
ncbi:DNA cytosine methyltransferase [Mangrovibacterium lignilyticum]|uniref:DNA cytosine methyltransferase n=1 Tax=Mangrovibacterium lignilyticum TaxID=2668052 RepID=UPI0013D2DCBA|nr:DNA cytosine methyltransferase [Mangrovibacterium lignilyticum]